MHNNGSLFFLSNMIIQQKEKVNLCEENNNKTKNNKNKKNNKRKDLEECNSNTSIDINKNNKKYKSSTDTYKDDTNIQHVYDYTHSLIENENILKIGAHNVQSFHNKVKQQQIINTIKIYR